MGEHGLPYEGKTCTCGVGPWGGEGFQRFQCQNCGGVDLGAPVPIGGAIRVENSRRPLREIFPTYAGHRVRYCEHCRAKSLIWREHRGGYSCARIGCPNFNVVYA